MIPALAPAPPLPGVRERSGGIVQPSMPPRDTWIALIEAALREDLGPGDATSEALLDADAPGDARLEARQDLVVCGLEVASAVFERVGARLEARTHDGARARPGEVLARVTGPARAILIGERTALNFAQRLAGIATWTRRHVEAIAGSGAQLVDTRKTTPGYRALEKYAVRCGGARNHRMGLYDGILIKDNHIRAVGGVKQAVERARARASSHLRIRVEVESTDMARAAIDAGADSLLIDNQSPGATRAIVELAAGRVRLESSGGIALDTIAEYARTGVDEISIGALTHSAPAADVALEWNADSAN